MLRFGVAGGGGGGEVGEADVEKVGRTSILTTHLLKPETEQQES